MTEKPRKISLIGARATTVLSISLVLIVIGLCGVLGSTVHRAAAAVGNETTILATVTPGQDSLTVSAIKRYVNNAPWADHYEFTNATTVLAREKNNMDDESRQALELLPGNPFGDEFVIYIKADFRSADSLAAVEQRLQTLEGIEFVTNNAATIGASNDGLHKILLYLSIFALALLAVAVGLIKNTITLAIYGRRFNIYTMRLVGATNSFIRHPFVRSGTITGAIAGAIAAVVICGIQFYLVNNEPMIGAYISYADMAIMAGVLIVAGALISRCATWWAANRYLNKSFDDLYKN